MSLTQSRIVAISYEKYDFIIIYYLDNDTHLSHSDVVHSMASGSHAWMTDSQLFL